MAPVRVLLVDDAEEARRDLRAALSLFDGIEIVGEAPNGAEALRLTESPQPDILLMDLEMPFMDGYEAAQRIKSKYPARKIVALTVHDYESAREKAKQSGVDAFLVKGAPVKTIVQAILNSTSVA